MREKSREMRKKDKKKIVQVAIRIEEEKLKEYKKWLIDHGYRSINKHLNEVIEEILEDKGKKGK